LVAVLLVLALLVLAPLAPRALVSRPMLRPVSRPRLRAPQWAPQWAPLLIRSSCGVRALRARPNNNDHRVREYLVNLVRSGERSEAGDLRAMAHPRDCALDCLLRGRR